MKNKTTIVWDEHYEKVGKIWDKADYAAREKMLRKSMFLLHNYEVQNLVLLRFIHLPYEVRRRLKLNHMNIPA